MDQPRYKGKCVPTAGDDEDTSQIERRYYWLHVLEFKVLRCINAAEAPNKTVACGGDNDVRVVVRAIRGRKRSPPPPPKPPPPSKRKRK